MPAKAPEPPQSPKPSVTDIKECTTVQIEGMVLLKLVNHCQSSLPQMATGQLLGLDVGTQLEVTSCFPFIQRESEDQQDEEVEREARDYQYEMLKALRDVNVDCNAVGWYCSIWQEGYLSTNVIETQYDYQKELGPNAICLVLDPLKTTHGKLWLRALRLQDKFMQMYKAGDFTQEMIKEKRLTQDEIFQELPITIHNNCLVDAFVRELATSREFTDPGAPEDAQELDTTGYLCYGLEGLVEGVEDLQGSWQRYMYDHKKWRNAELYKDAAAKGPAPKPSRLDSMLLSKQMMNHCNYLERVGLRNFENLYFAETIHKVTEGPRDQP
jgi:translation initiation factor 3 subunit H